MKINCQQNILQKALNIVGKNVGNQNTLPVLNNILISTQKEANQVILCSTNLEIGIQVKIEAEILEAGGITIPAKLITSYVNYLQDEEIHLSSNSQAELSITSSSSKTLIKGITAEEFPSIPQIDSQLQFSLPITQLLEALSLTLFASSFSNTKPVLGGVLFKGEGQTITCVATDSFRLSEKKIHLEKPVNNFQVIIPSATLAEVSRIFAQYSSEDISISVSDTQISLSAKDITITSRLIDGKYPDYTQIIPQNNTIKTVFPKEQTLMVLKRISFFARENNNSVHIVLSKDKAVFSTESGQYGSELDEMSISCDGEVDIYLNIDFLLEVFNNIKKEDIIMEFSNNISPACIKLDNDTQFIHIIMPLKI